MNDSNSLHFCCNHIRQNPLMLNKQLVTTGQSVQLAENDLIRWIPTSKHHYVFHITGERAPSLFKVPPKHKNGSIFNQQTKDMQKRSSKKRRNLPPVPLFSPSPVRNSGRAQGENENPLPPKRLRLDQGMNVTQHLKFSKT